MNPHTAFSMSATADYTPPPRNGINFGIAQTYEIRYSHPDGSGWVEYIHNLIPNVALNTMLDIIYGATAKFGSLYVFLVTGPGAGNTYAATDTMAAHAGWTEAVPYSDGTRPVATFAAAASQSTSNSGSPAVFNINGTATIAGVGLSTSNVKSGTAGTCVGVGNFSGGDRAVAPGGTLTVTVTATAAST